LSDPIQRESDPTAAPDEFVPGRAPDPSIQRVGAANACPGCGSLQVRSLCQGGDAMYGTTERLFLVVECRDCRMVRLYPRPEPGEMQRLYPAELLPEPGGGVASLTRALIERLLRHDRVRFVRQVLRHVTAAGPVLDVGCGHGHVLRELNLGPGRIFGIDFSVNAAAVAWSWNAVPAVCGALPSAPFPDRTFAVISMFQVLEHLYDPLVYIETAARLLQPEGRLILQVPDAESWQFMLFGERWCGLDIPRHLIIFRMRDLDNLLRYAGLEVVRRRRFAWCDAAAMFAASLAPTLHPEVRRRRQLDENDVAAMFKHFAFGVLWLLGLIFSLIEAACGSGATITIEARLQREARANS
jgi:SAM-dependent methyltransferase